MNAEEPKKLNIGLIFFFFIAALILYASWRIISPFIVPLVLAAVTVTFTHRVYLRVTEKLKGRKNLAAVVMLLAITFFLILPAFILSMMMIDQATHLFAILQKIDVRQAIAELRISDRVATYGRYIPGFNPASFQPEQMMLGALKQIPGLVAAHGAQVLSQAFGLIVGFALMLLASFYFYTDGDRLVRELVFLSPLPDIYDRELLLRIRNVIDATFRGQVLTAIAQGTVTGIGLAIVGIPGAFFWGAIAAVFSLIPMVGAAVVWVPAAAYLFFRASTLGMWRAIFLVAWGILIVSLVDNVIRPWAMKGGTEMPAVVLLFSILGGIQVFGFVGILMGPLVFVLAISLLDMYRDVFKGTLVAQENTTTPAELS